MGMTRPVIVIGWVAFLTAIRTDVIRRAYIALLRSSADLLHHIRFDRIPDERKVTFRKIASRSWRIL